MKTKIHAVTYLASMLILPIQTLHAELGPLGYRPTTESTARFLQQVDSSRFIVFPAILRTGRWEKMDWQNESQTYSTAARDNMVAFLNENGLGTAQAAEVEFDIMQATGKGQFAVFNNSIEAIGKQLADVEVDADYLLIVEVAGGGKEKLSAGGVHCYILDCNGTNVFSFLFNNHHPAFNEAGFQTWDTSIKGKEELIAKGVQLAMASLKFQVELEQALETYQPNPRYAGKYTGKEDPTANYLQLYEDGTYEVKDDGHEMEGSYAVVTKQNVLVLIDSERGNMPVGSFENGKLTIMMGEELTRTPIK